MSLMSVLSRYCARAQSLSRVRLSLTRLALAACLLVPLSGAAAPKDGEKFKDWTVRCEQFKDQKQKSFTQCHIFQDLKHRTRGIRLLHMAVAYPPQRSQQAVGILTMPLGVYLPAGVKLQIDKRAPVAVVFERCEPVGCKAGFPLEERMLRALKKGAKANITFHDMRRKPVTIPVSLRGFTAALRSLK